MIKLKRLTHQNLTHAMQLVTESYDNEVRRGMRDEDYEDDWMIEYSKFVSVARGMPYLGIVGYEKRDPVAVALISASPVYGPGWGVFSWFYVSPVVKSMVLPRKIAREAIDGCRKMGMKNMVAYIGFGNEKVKRMMEHIGMEPCQVEYRGSLDSMTGCAEETQVQSISESRL